MAWEQNPRGVTFTRQQTEYQQFPEEFFSGADVVVYFGDVWLADITSLQFALMENVRPIYGYASYTWDAVKRGTRLIQGRFSIAFKEAGYLYRVLDHIGQLGGRVAPSLAHLLAGETGVPQWHADALQTIEELLVQYTGRPGPTGATRYTLIRPGEYEETPDYRAVMWVRDLGQRLGVPVDFDQQTMQPIIGGKKFPPQRIENGRAYVYVRQVAEALGYTVFWNKDTEYIILVPPGSVLLTPDRFVVIPGQDRAVMPASAVELIIGKAITRIDSDGVYYAERRFERVDGIFPNEPGVYVREVLQAFNYAVDYVKGAECIVYAPPAKAAAKQPPGPSRYTEAMNKYEAEIWGDPFVEERSRHRHFVPYFYSGPNMAPLQKYGFDIYIVYGPLPYHVKERLNVLPDVITYNTTVKAIRNVQLTGCSQVLDPTGRPVEEVYEFIARDMD